MAKRPGTSRDHDFVANARRVVEQAIGEHLDGTPLSKDDKDPRAIPRGQSGGKKGGKARAARLTEEQRSEIARVAAEARWKKKPSS